MDCQRTSGFLIWLKGSCHVLPLQNESETLQDMTIGSKFGQSLGHHPQFIPPWAAWCSFKLHPKPLVRH
ncbi:hypothetical protein IRJ41_013036 [Triplophysa rosa]|uniref:Uncharacterized protein n=1 Tax=Triplophysa rosa TaxID=992332 RepID=A0A9W7X2T6_TRIRA|nr:hypothetical protein IRJ41_013036 [Triplophysa rosa]